MLLHRDTPGLVLKGGFWYHPQSRQMLAHWWADYTHEGVTFEAGDQRFYVTASWHVNTMAIRVRTYTRHTPQELVQALRADGWEQAGPSRRARLRRRLVSELFRHAGEYGEAIGQQMRCDLCGLLWRPRTHTGSGVWCACPPRRRIDHGIERQLQALARLEEAQRGAGA